MLCLLVQNVRVEDSLGYIPGRHTPMPRPDSASLTSPTFLRRLTVWWSPRGQRSEAHPRVWLRVYCEPSRELSPVR